MQSRRHERCILGNGLVGNELVLQEPGLDLQHPQKAEHNRPHLHSQHWRGGPRRMPAKQFSLTGELQATEKLYLKNNGQFPEGDI